MPANILTRNSFFRRIAQGVFYQNLLDIVQTMFVPNYQTYGGVALTVTEDLRGATVIVTNASAVSVVLPKTLGTGFIVGFVQYGAGQITFSSDATIRGGVHSSGQYAKASAELLPNGEWLMSGVIA